MSQIAQRFYLPTLMRTGLFDVRGIAAKEPGITGVDYLNRIANLLDVHIPDTLRLLPRRGIKDISKIQTPLERVGCHTFSAELCDIVAEKTPEDARKLLRGALAAFQQRVTRFQDPPRSLVGEDLSYPVLINESLSQVLTILDKDEATRPLRILVVDDAAFMISNIRSLLEKTYLIHGLTKPEAMDRVLDHLVPELFILDYIMPEMNGFDLIPIIRARKEHRDTPIIFLTSVGTADHIIKSVNLGACDYIVKPFQPEALLIKIEKHVVRKKTF